MLPIKRRVKKESFEKIMKEGVFVHSPSFYIRILDRKDDTVSLFGFVVPAKVKKTSVGRHKIKRKMTVIIEKNIKAIKNGLSCLFFLKKDISINTNINIEEEMVELFKKAKMLNEGVK